MARDAKECAISWCHNVCTTHFCPSCRRQIYEILVDRPRVARVRAELRLPEGWLIPVVALWLMSSPEETFTIQEVADIAGVSNDVVRHYCRKSRRFKRSGRRHEYRVPRRDAIKILRARLSRDKLRETHMTLEEASQLTGLTTHGLRTLAFKGVITLEHPGIGYNLYMAREVAERIAHERKDLMSISEASRLTGISRDAIAKVVRAGLVRVEGLSTDTRARIGIDRNELKRLRRLVRRPKRRVRRRKNSPQTRR